MDSRERLERRRRARRRREVRDEGRDSLRREATAARCGDDGERREKERGGEVAISFDFSKEGAATCAESSSLSLSFSSSRLSSLRSRIINKRSTRSHAI